MENQISEGEKIITGVIVLVIATVLETLIAGYIGTILAPQIKYKLATIYLIWAGSISAAAVLVFLAPKVDRKPEFILLATSSVTLMCFWWVAIWATSFFILPIYLPIWVTTLIWTFAFWFIILVFTIGKVRLFQWGYNLDPNPYDW